MFLPKMETSQIPFQINTYRNINTTQEEGIVITQIKCLNILLIFKKIELRNAWDRRKMQTSWCWYSVELLQFI